MGPIYTTCRRLREGKVLLRHRSCPKIGPDLIKVRVPKIPARGKYCELAGVSGTPDPFPPTLNLTLRHGTEPREAVVFLQYLLFVGFTLPCSATLLPALSLLGIQLASTCHGTNCLSQSPSQLL